MTSNTIKTTILAILADAEYDFYGLRFDDAEYAADDTCNASHQWWQDDPNEGLDEDDAEYAPYNADLHLWDGGELDGTCAIMVTANNIDQALARMNMYKCCGGNLYLIAGDCADNGNDVDEIVINDANVLEKF